MTEASKGIEFWQDCKPPKGGSVLAAYHEDGTAYLSFVDCAGVEYRRVHTTRSQQETGKPAFIWQRKMWRMSLES